MFTDVSFYWFEIFGNNLIVKKISKLIYECLKLFSANIGGLTGVVGGISLIGFSEIFYFIIKQIFLFIMRKFKVIAKHHDLHIYP